MEGRNLDTGAGGRVPGIVGSKKPHRGMAGKAEDKVRDRAEDKAQDLAQVYRPAAGAGEADRISGPDSVYFSAVSGFELPPQQGR